jgi:hypothetical protein
MTRLARPQSKYESIKYELTLPCREIDTDSLVLLSWYNTSIGWKLADIN